jgi:hypothetical protein
MKNTGAVALFFLILIFTFSTVYGGGYTRDPWGSRTWKGSGRPPHWSPERPKSGHAPPRMVQPIAPERPIDPGYGVRPPLAGSGGGYWRDRHKRWRYHKKRRGGYMYYRQPRVETRIVEKQRIVPVYVPVQSPKPSRLMCAGDSVTRRDPKTGGLIIEFTSGARACR